MNVAEWERMGRDLRARAARWEHPAAEPASDDEAAALNELAEAFRAAMGEPRIGQAPTRGSQ